MKIKERVAAYIKAHNMIKENETVCVGLSGGADSVFLLQVLWELRDLLGIRLSAFHVNHCLRGAESDADQAFAQRFCAEKGIQCRVYAYDISALSADEKKGTEEMGRLMRRKSAQECLADGFADKIALAHHLNDRAETVLFHLARGSSLAGLSGIRPVNGKIIRPLLFLKREEIETALLERRISWCTDSTNLQADCTRNILRLEVLPILTESVNAGSAAHIAEAAEDLALADSLLADLAAQKSPDLTAVRKEGILLLPPLTGENRLLAGYIVLDALKKLSGTSVDLTRTAVRQVLFLMEAQTGRRIDLPYGITAERGYDGVLLRKKQTEPETDRTAEVLLEIGREVRFQGMTFFAELEKNRDPMEKIPKKIYTKWFDYDKMAGCVLRFRRNGDYLYTDSAMHKKKLKDYLIDEKIPLRERDRLVCLANGARIAWVAGYRISEDCRVTKDTKRILKITVLGGNEDECEYQSAD